MDDISLLNIIGTKRDRLVIGWERPRTYNTSSIVWGDTSGLLSKIAVEIILIIFLGKWLLKLLNRLCT